MSNRGHPGGSAHRQARYRDDPHHRVKHSQDLPHWRHGDPAPVGQGAPTDSNPTTPDRTSIARPAGDETQLDWVDVPDPPLGWGLSGHAHLLVGALAHSSKWRGVLAPCEDQPHLIEALDALVDRLGGCTLAWRFDRMRAV